MLTLGTADLKAAWELGLTTVPGSAAPQRRADVHRPIYRLPRRLLGARRVLMIAASLFTLLCALLPLVHSYSLLITMLVLAGLRPERSIR